MRSSIFQMRRPRSEGVMRPQGPLSKAVRAALTARFMSSASPSATLASVSPVAGLGVADVFPEAASVHCPSMNSLRGAAVNSSTLLSTVTVMRYPISFGCGSHNETTGARTSTRGAPKARGEADRRDHLAGRPAGRHSGVMIAPPGLSPGCPPWFARPAARAWTCAPGPGGVQAFHAGLPGYAPTPLAEVPALAAGLGAGRAFVKHHSAPLAPPPFHV